MENNEGIPMEVAYTIAGNIDLPNFFIWPSLIVESTSPFHRSWIHLSQNPIR